MTYDLYDLLISSQGYQLEGITDEMVEQNQEEIYKLKKELGIETENEQYSLVLFDDKIHKMDEASEAIMSLGIPPEEAMWKMYLTHDTGSCTLKIGPFEELKRMQDKLKADNYSTEIVKKENDIQE